MLYVCSLFMLNNKLFKLVSCVRSKTITIFLPSRAAQDYKSSKQVPALAPYTSSSCLSLAVAMLCHRSPIFKQFFFRYLAFFKLSKRKFLRVFERDQRVLPMPDQ